MHHSVCFCGFGKLCFRTSATTVYGLASGLWDLAYGTRIPAAVRSALYGPPFRRRSAPRREGALLLTSEMSARS